MTRCPRAGVAALLLLLLAGQACGRRSAPRPPEDVAPDVIRDLRARVTDDGIELAWTRPRHYVDGSRMPDLGGFFIERASGDVRDARFERLHVLTVSDQQRFQKAGRFRFLDSSGQARSAYRYRVVSFTVDGYVGAPSNVAPVAAGEADPNPSAHP